MDGVDGVGSGTLAGSTCMGDGGRTTGVGADAGTTVDASAGAGAGVDVEGVRVKEKFEGPGL